METWRFLVSLAALLLVWAGVVSILGEPPTPVAILVAAVFAAIGLYLSETVTDRFFGDGSE